MKIHSILLFVSVVALGAACAGNRLEVEPSDHAHGDFQLQNISKIKDCPEAHSPEWSEDGKFLFFTCQGEVENTKIVEVRLQDGLLTVSTPQENLHLVTPSEPEPKREKRAPCVAPYPEERSSADGKSIFFVSLRRRVRNIVWKNARTQQILPLTEWSFDTFKPTWSTDEKYLSLYTRYHPQAADGKISILLLPGERRTAYSGMELIKSVALTDVRADEQGPLFWQKYLLTIRNVPEANLITVMNLETRKTFMLDTGYNENHKLRLSRNGVLAIEVMDHGKSQILLATLS